MTKELRRCPFCGGEIERHRDSYYIDHKSSCFLFRNHVNFINENELEAWNRREPMDEIVQQLEEKYNHYSNMDSMVALGRRLAYKEAIEIVKKGGAV